MRQLRIGFAYGRKCLACCCCPERQAHEDAVEYFQMNLDSYGIEDAIMLDEIDGIVGDETLKAIEKAIKNKDNG